MIAVSIRAFAPFDRLLGAKTLQVELKDDATCRDLVGELALVGRDRAKLESLDDEHLLHHVALIRRHELLRVNDKLEDGDEVGVLPPISGGAR